MGGRRPGTRSSPVCWAAQDGDNREVIEMGIFRRKSVLDRVRGIKIDRDILLIVVDTLVYIGRDIVKDYLRRKFKSPKVGGRFVDMGGRITKTIIRKST